MRRVFWKLDVVFVAEVGKSVSLSEPARVPCNLFGAGGKESATFLAFFLLGHFSVRHLPYLDLDIGA